MQSFFLRRRIRPFAPRLPLRAGDTEHAVQKALGPHSIG